MPAWIAVANIPTDKKRGSSRRHLLFFFVKPNFIHNDVNRPVLRGPLNPFFFRRTLHWKCLFFRPMSSSRIRLFKLTLDERNVQMQVLLRLKRMLESAWCKRSSACRRDKIYQPEKMCVRSLGPCTSSEYREKAQAAPRQPEESMERTTVHS